MVQSAEDVARESVECYSAGDFDRLRSLLADDFYEEELATQRRLEGAVSAGRDCAGLEAGVSGRARHDHRGVHERKHGGARGHLGGHAERPDGDARRTRVPAVEQTETVKSVQVIEVEDGKMKALRTYFDLMTLLQQIGAMDQAEKQR